MLRQQPHSGTAISYKIDERGVPEVGKMQTHSAFRLPVSMFYMRVVGEIRLIHKTLFPTLSLTPPYPLCLPYHAFHGIGATTSLIQGCHCLPLNLKHFLLFWDNPSLISDFKVRCEYSLCYTNIIIKI